jgi:hypothetical protein
MSSTNYCVKISVTRKDLSQIFLSGADTWGGPQAELARSIFRRHVDSGKVKLEYQFSVDGLTLTVIGRSEDQNLFDELKSMDIDFTDKAKDGFEINIEYFEESA